MKNLPLHLLAVAAFFSFALASCDKNDRDELTTPDPVADTIAIHFQQTEWLSSSLQATFDNVVSDSRCPCNADCVSPGAVTVKLDFNYDGEIFSKTLSLGESPSSTIIGSQKVTLVEVLPYPCDMVIEPSIKVVVTPQ
jgi:hypothetical protein